MTGLDQLRAWGVPVVTGTVTGFFTRFTVDGPDDGRAPDELPLEGTVTFTPQVRVVSWPDADPPRTSVIDDFTIRLSDGWLGDAEGVELLATEQPAAVPPVIPWRVSFNLRGVSIPAVTFPVPSGGSLDLTTLVGADADVPPIPELPTAGAVKTVNRIAPDGAGNVQTITEVRLSGAAFALIKEPDPRVLYLIDKE